MVDQFSSLSCTVQTITVRVAGPVPTGVHVDHPATGEQQAGVRAGDVLTYLHHSRVAQVLAGVFQRAQRLAELQLPEQAAATWLHPEPGTYPAGVLLRFGSVPAVGLESVPRRRVRDQLEPQHLAARIGPLRWQICDQQAARALAHAWAQAHRALT